MSTSISTSTPHSDTFPIISECGILKCSDVLTVLHEYLHNLHGGFELFECFLLALQVFDEHWGINKYRWNNATKHLILAAPAGANTAHISVVFAYSQTAKLPLTHSCLLSRLTSRVKWRSGKLWGGWFQTDFWHCCIWQNLCLAVNLFDQSKNNWNLN